MSEETEATPSSQKESKGFFHRLFGRGEGRRSASASQLLDLDDIQGIILRGYRMPIVRHFLLKVDVPAAARKLLGRLASGDETDAPRSRLPKTGMSDLSPAPETTRLPLRAARPTIA